MDKGGFNSEGKGPGKILKRANPSTIQDKFLVGYQGWFTCPGDGEPVGPGHHGWLHWFNKPIPQGGRPNTDLWPDVSSYSPSELFPAPGLSMKSGDPVFLFSSRNAKTVQRHFHWMAEHGVDGAFLQRFAGQTDVEGGNDGILRIRDEVGDRVREAAEREGRVFAIMYDVSGVPADKIQPILERDWVHLIRQKTVLDSPNYLKEKGKPVVALWGFGFDNAGHTPALVRAITKFFRSSTPGGVYLFAGTPAHWRTAESDADRNPEFLDVWLNEFDAISPWTVGRYKNEQEAFQFAESKMKGDMELVKRRNEGDHKKIDYIPVVLPGGSGFNLSEGKWGFNDIRRNGGRFLWHQIYNARRIGAKTIYGAMWDEYDEGTAFMPVVTSKRMLPASDIFPFMALDEDGYDLPSDWYMRICGFAAEVIRNERRLFETFPSKELQDYWGTRPHFEEIIGTETGFVSGSSVSKDSSSASGSGSGVGDGQSYQEWLALQKEDKDGPPPPPYSLESDDAPTPALSSAPSVVAAASLVVAQTSSSANTTPNSGQQSFNSSGQPSGSIQQTPEGHSQISNQIQQAPGEYHRTNSNSSHQQLANVSSQHHQTVQTGVDPVENLANEFGKHGISSPEPPYANLSMSPPPLHPAHPASNLQQHSLNTGTHSRPGSLSRPSGTQSQNGHSASTQPPASGQDATPTGNLWGQSQWPPAEWGATSSSRPQQQAHPHVAQPVGSGANLTRPHTFSAPHSTGAPLRPHVSLASRPQHQAAQPSHFSGYGNGPSSFASGPGPGSSLSMPSYSSSGPASPYPASPITTPSSYIPSPPNTPPHTIYGGSAYSSASFPAPHTWSGGPPHASPPPVASMSTYPGQGGYSPQAQAFGYQPSPFFNSSLPSPQMSMTHGYGHSHEQSPYFPQGPGGEDYWNNGASQHMHAPHQMPNYPGFSSSHGSYPQAQASSPPEPNTGPWIPGAQAQAAPPAMPPRPPNQSSFNRPPQSAPSFPVASGAGASALGFALSAVDKVAGRRTRDQLENQVGNLAHSGSKLLSKFTK